MHYLDNSATTKVSIKSAEKALYVMTENFGNPSSSHSLGFEAEKEIRNAREIILNALSAQSGDLIFTSGGTESDNLAIFGACEQNKHFGKKIVTTAIEHAGVLNTMKQLENRGFEVVYIKPDMNGNIKKEDIFEAITSDTILVSMMSVNNETGAISPIEYVSKAIKRSGSKALFHVDNVQGFQKIKLNIAKLGIDLMSISAHKVHAPKGCGALYIAKNAKIKPMIFGGVQEHSLRAGTENVASIAAFGVAVSENTNQNSEPIKDLKNYLIEKLNTFESIEIISPENSSPYIINFSLGKIKGETMLHFLSERKIYVSTASACSGANLSHVLTAMNLSRNKIESSLRISFSKHNTREDIDALIEAIQEGFVAIASK